MKHLCNIFDTPIDFLRRELSRMQWKRHILINTQVWIEDMRLEDESDITFCGSFVVDADIVEIDRAFFRFIQPSNTPKRRRFSCPCLTEQHKEFFVPNIKRDVVKRD